MVEGHVRKERELFEKFLQTRDRRTYEIYERKRTEVKRIKETSI